MVASVLEIKVKYEPAMMRVIGLLGEIKAAPTQEQRDRLVDELGAIILDNLVAESAHDGSNHD